MARWSFTRSVQLFCLVLSCTLLGFVAYKSANTSQKSIRGYQNLEQQLPQQLRGKSLDPQTEAEKEEEKLGFVRSGFNQFRSDRIPLDREIPDTRDPR